MSSRALLSIAATVALAALACEGDRAPRRSPGKEQPRPASRPRPAQAPDSPTPPIPAPPLRLDARAHPEELSFFPADVPVLLSGRPDLLDRLAAPGGWMAHYLGRVPWFSRAVSAIGEQSPSKVLGLDHGRCWVLALIQDPQTARAGLEQAIERQTAPSARPGEKLAAWPGLNLRLRLVAALSDAGRARAALAKLPGAMTRLGISDLRAIDDPVLPKPLGALAARGTFLARFAAPDGLAMAASIVGRHLIVDLVLPVTGPLDAFQAARLLAPPSPGRPPLAPMPDGAGKREATAPAEPAPILSDPFVKVSLLAGADLTLLIRGDAMAEAAMWLGMRQAIKALVVVEAKERNEMLRTAWRIARIPRAIAQTQPRPFDRFALHLHLAEKTPLVTLSWRMTPLGQRLLDGVLPKVAGRDLGRGNRFIDELLRPLAASVQKDLPPVEPWLDKGLMTRLSEGGPLTWVVILAEHWPRLLILPEIRKTLLDMARQELRPARYVHRVNALRQGDLFLLRLEGRPIGSRGSAPPPARR